jgi:hypothetical protein
MRVLRHSERLGQLIIMCHDVSMIWRQDGYLSDSASPMRFMCLRVGRCSCANFVINILYAVFEGG